jgi:hypothetical protein
LADRLRVLLDDGTGRIQPPLQPLATLLTGAENAEAMLRWVSRRNGAVLLRELAAGELELSHAALNARGTGQTTTYLRGLLVAAGILPDEDQVLVDFERWLRRRLGTLAGHPYQQLLRQFGWWHQLPRMRTKSTRARLPAGAYLYARDQFKAAQSLLTWIADTGRTLSRLGQAELDTWFATARRSDRARSRGLLTWAMSHGHMPAGRLPALPGESGPSMTQRQRLDLLRQCTNDDAGALAVRVAAVLLLLFGQPLTRVRVLTLDDVTTTDDGAATIRLGDPPIPVPKPFATLLLDLCGNRENMAVTANAGCRWLFPGRGPGQPISHESLRRRLIGIGVPIGRTRVAALRQLVLDVPPPVAATALGFAHFTAHRHVARAGGTWSRYVASNQNL